ncbi:MAG: D-glycero-beta-D-manno-heptose-7-phosphate kinase [Ignavibacteriales bacterium]|nr:MAG: D-glycero-beta-D-manno-heptose-7-phosphate kinase [Ignavibacteriaceae bacterium]MBW7872117.1 D-glycero-beta-D-manno-heptose-7-phosphate kinase [Ignavibacteria bacterium]MCZ2143751.1 D-glycero-beta-D-manno-heptose-7-phosphate kinase [Ignavibacteriales bacterium]OQY74335.1 MAG: D-glycero-beta-D-manno-heptose-7-phosphate kinase [Ignavibacteriales bacterium UTCHB3]MBV6445988.1 Bifunctional protein HldE [Ignavibacteriaceae bacterium]
MINFSEERLNRLKSAFFGKRVAIVGDMMLDGYVMGGAKRISPEAPVPVVDVEDEFYRFGGAANCANNILHLNGVPLALGIIGEDRAGEIFLNLLKEEKIEGIGLISDPNRHTTLKTRIIAGSQHVVRFDRENKEEITSETEERLLAVLRSNIDSIDAVILQDYNKGVLTASLIGQIIALCKEKNKLVTVDPKFNNFFLYKGVTVFKPNRKEAGDILGFGLKTTDDVLRAGEILLEKLEAENILLTLGEDGIAVFNRGNAPRMMPTKARKVADVSGAGDTVISTLTIALAAGANIYEACYIANYAAGIVCEEVGIVPVNINTLFDTIIEGLR